MTTNLYQTIDLRTAAGGTELTWPLTISEATGKNIAGVTIELSLGTDRAPGAWRAPDVDRNPTTSSRVVQMLIGAAVRPRAFDHYYLWSRVTDSPEIAPRRNQRIAVLADPVP